MFVNKFDLRLLSDKDTDAGGGGSGPEASFQRLLDRNAQDGIALARQLFAENYDGRKEIRDLKTQLADLQGKVPTENAVVLTGDDAKAWAAYQAMGKPDEVQAAIDEKAKLQGQLAEKERSETLRTVAETAQFKPAVLSQLDRMAAAQGKTLAYDVRDVTVDGETVKAAYVKDGDKESPLSDYATANWSDFLPALSAQSAQSGQGSTQQPTGTRYPSQHAGNGTQKPQTTKAVAESYVAKTYARPKRE